MIDRKLVSCNIFQNEPYSIGPAYKESLRKTVTLNGEPRTLEHLQVSVIQSLETILGKAVRPFTHQAYRHQGIRVVDGGIRISYNAMQSDEFIHVAFPALIFRSLEYFYLLAVTKNH
jgi:hypothetical protein